MFDTITASSSISFIFVFAEGLLSFFSPCVIPLIPVYMGYLAGNTDEIGTDGLISYNRRRVFFNTIFFVIGISFAFFILGMSFTAFGSFFQNRQLRFTKAAGIIIIALGLFQLGFFELEFLNIEKKFHLDLNKRKANPAVAFILGFTYSFAWTPCIGPALSSVLILASTASSSAVGNLLVLVYAAGFIIPFLLLGLFTSEILNFLRKKQKFLKYTVKAGGVILLAMGIMTYTGWLNGISGYLNSISSNGIQQEEPAKNSYEKAESNAPAPSEKSEEQKKISSIDFTLTDQYGKSHTLSEYRGKVVFLNFWATWCPPCKKEMPDIEALYNEYGKNQGDVIFLGVANPYSEENKNTKETDKKGILEFLDENGYTFPVVFDETGEVYTKYNITALPTTFLIDKDGNIQGYAPGMLTKEIMKNAINETLEAK
jgi:cytochrome c-type biogenesis protein